MTGYVTLYTKETIASFINNRPGEEKFGQAVGSLENWGELASHPAPYVLVGIAEDIGVRANRGIAGTSGAWRTALTALLNIQANSYTNPSKLVVLGEIDCSRQMAQALEISEDDAHRFEKWGALVTQIDDKVAVVVRELVAMGKTPILIGGGHNNSFGNLKGTSEALDTAIHCINLDAHSDFRALEHRHSGNGFSHAAAQGYLDRYYILGLHRNYTSKALFQRLNEQHDTLRYSLFEDIFVKRTTTLAEAFGKAERFCTEAPFGLELDMDSIAGMGSSALSPSGISLEDARHFLHYFSRKSQCHYIHICEGAPGREAYPNQVGKAIAYLVSDVIS